MASPEAETLAAQVGVPSVDSSRGLKLVRAPGAGAELRVYPGAGHIPMEELPEATARDADAFLGPP